MPVVNPGENTNTVTKALTGGEVDLNPPYASADSDDSDDDEKKAENAGRVRSGALVAERWQKLAGIIKG
jgi:hypothetical protein